MCADSMELARAREAIPSLKMLYAGDIADLY